MASIRWSFKDEVTDEVWDLPINPDSMSSPLRVRGRSVSHAGAGALVVAELDRAPVDWQFGGVIRSKAFHDALDEWASRDSIVQVTDHLHRSFRVIFTAFEATERRPTQNARWRQRYIMRSMILEELFSLYPPIYPEDY